jgi:predicted nucleic acid-binding protein
VKNGSGNKPESSIAYIDTSALIKLVVTEPETEALHSALQQYRHHFASDLIVIELLRSVRKQGSHLFESAKGVISGLALCPITRQVTALASTIDPPYLRSLDAIHLATAQLHAQHIEAFITYDRKLHTAAEAAGIKVLSPR